MKKIIYITLNLFQDQGVYINKSRILAFLIFAILNSGCAKFVEIEPPKNLLVTSSVYKSDDGANSALAGIYIQMIDQGTVPFQLGAFTALSADELSTLNSSYVQCYNNALQPLNAPTNDVWTNAYNYIYNANAVYEGCESSGLLTPSVKKQLMAEARFIRAFWYFYLVNLYDDVPLILNTDYVQNATAARALKKQVYQQIITDLLYAQNNLNDDYVSSNSVTATTDRVRPNKMAATALLSRVYLYTNNYTDAEVLATSIIDKTTVYNLELPENAFLKESKEAIWQLATPTPADINTTEGRYYILTGAPGGGSTRSTAFLPGLKNAFEANDLRFAKWVGKVTVAGIDYYYPFKYKVRSSSTITEHSIVFRLAEQYLIRAECRAQLDKLSLAIDDVDAIRGRAGIPTIKSTNPGISKENLLTAILKERRTELFCEYGHRWLDLKRLGKINEVMGAVAPSKNAVWETFKQLWPIPQTDIGNDVKLIQNPGYK